MFDSQSHIKGTIEFDGAVLPVIHLAQQLGFNEDSQTISEFIVINDGKSDWAIAVSNIDKIIAINNDEINRDADNTEHFISAYSSDDNGLLTLLSAKNICQYNHELALKNSL